MYRIEMNLWNSETGCDEWTYLTSSTREGILELIIKNWDRVQISGFGKSGNGILDAIEYVEN